MQKRNPLSKNPDFVFSLLSPNFDLQMTPEQNCAPDKGTEPLGEILSRPPAVGKWGPVSQTV